MLETRLTFTLGCDFFTPFMSDGGFRVSLCSHHISEYYSLSIPSKAGEEVITVNALQEDVDRVLSLIYEGRDRAAKVVAEVAINVAWAAGGGQLEAPGEK